MGLDNFILTARGTLKNSINLTSVLKGQSGSGQFRVTWLRRVLIAWWFLTLVVVALFFLGEIGGLISLATSRHPHNPNFDMGLLLESYINGVGFLNLIFDFWVIGALLFLGPVWNRRAQTLAPSGKEAKIGSIVIAIALVFGRLSALFWSFFLGFIPTSSGFLLFWPIKYIFLPPVLLFCAGIFAMISLYFSFTVMIATLVWFPLKVYQSVFHIVNGLSVTDGLRTAFFSSIFSFWYWFTGRTLPNVEQAPDDSKGARFATPSEIAAQYAKNGVAFGHESGEPLFLHTEKHILLQASTRSGKGVALIIPHLLRYKGSAFVLDPKGENARATGRQRTKINDQVHYLDPFGISGKVQSRFNPLSRFTLDNMEAESKALAAALVLGDGGNKRDHWTSSAQQLLAALILHVFTAPDIAPENKDLPMVRRLLLRDMNGVLTAMAQSTVADGLLANLALSFLDTPEKEFGSILSSAQRETEILDNPFITKCLSGSGSGSEVDFSAWRNSTMTVYLCLSAPKFPVFNRWLRLVLTAALDEMTDTLNPPALPVCFMLDELATLGHLQSVENAVGLAAGYGIQLVTVFQDVAQMKDLYKGRWASFIGNAGIRALFNLDDYDTAQYWSKFIGGRLVQTQNHQQNNLGLETGQSFGEAIRPLLSPEEIMLHFAKDQMLVLAQGARPIITNRVAYWNDRGLDTLWDDPRPAKTEANPSGKSNPSTPPPQSKNVDMRKRKRG